MNWSNEQIEHAYQNKEFKKAVDLLDQVQVDLHDADFFEKRAMCFFHMKEFEKAIQDFNRAQQLDPNNPYRYSSRAFAKGANKDVDGAIEDYQKAIHLDPSDAIAHNNLGLLHEQKGYAKMAQSSFAKSDELIGRKPIEQIHTQEEIKPADHQEEEVHLESKKLSMHIFDVFSSSKGFKEFLNFIKNGFRLKP